jgi:hypothetical protein
VILEEGRFAAPESDMSLPLNLAGISANQKTTNFEGIIEVGSWMY